MAEPAIGVCGYGRCGSSMVMHMLAAGGVPIAGGAEPPSYELPDIEDTWTIPLAGRAVKLLDAVLHSDLPPADRWRLVWLDRDPVEQARSQVKFLEAMVGPLPEPREVAVEQFARGYQRDRPHALGLLHGHGRVLVLRYEQVLADPPAGARRLRELWPALDVDAAASVVHERDGRCLPGLPDVFPEGVAMPAP